MTTLLGPCPCASCGAIVTVVRRPVVLWGHKSDCGRYHPPCVSAESLELREVVTLDALRVEHACYTAMVGISDAPSRILLDALSVADTSREGVPRLEVSAP